MSINDPIVITWNERRKAFYFVQGRETFYDNEDCLIEFDTLDEAFEFAFDYFPSGLLKVQEEIQEEIIPAVKVKDDRRQLRLF